MTIEINTSAIAARNHLCTDSKIHTLDTLLGIPVHPLNDAKI